MAMNLGNLHRLRAGGIFRDELTSLYGISKRLDFANQGPGGDKDSDSLRLESLAILRGGSLLKRGASQQVHTAGGLGNSSLWLKRDRKCTYDFLVYLCHLLDLEKDLLPGIQNVEYAGTDRLVILDYPQLVIHIRWCRGEV